MIGTNGAGRYRTLACGCFAPADAARSSGGGALRPHILPPGYLAALGAEKIFRQAGGVYAGPLEWTPAGAVELMDQCGVATGIASVSAPGTWFGDVAEGRKLSRICNEYAARISSDFPGRFGSFAALPLPDVEGSLREIEYAFDTLKADGICLMTSYGNRWPGEKEFAPVFEELNRRGAIVYTHPVAPDCCRGLLAQTHDSVIEYATDTTRAIAQLLFSGSAARYPKIRFIFSHAGGTMPFLAQRFINAHRFARGDAQANLPDGVLPALNRFYYDTAQAAHPYAMSSFKQVVQLSQLLFGTDFPYVSAALTAKGLQSCGFAEQELAGIYRGNAVRLLPRLDV